ncbi:S41 family peptidase [Flavobacterium sp. Fl-77]|uniref:S41 family peptidase n=1 Tax=Flavobacterium flavipigmentatum TaxID=2893884 RepID=A0AAJ2SBK4_9FLAO|nr:MULTISPECIES: S41 family peptidase [unclassified Flavobacterium]MDX6181600.1 S41 family peptidase [Flavobacterium sp. Fl-33]MDX6185366.1 S41 family peptidase [Flavobacterium sp. Fl-77]UFH37470.1 PDZ domain-containing protein [Flavobacterium sp. F-70]
MKKNSLLFLLTSGALFSQNSTKTCEILNKINSLIQSEHIQPKPVDDSLSAFVFDNLMNELDPARNIFFKSEYKELSQKYRLNLDDLILKNDCSFLSDIEKTYHTGLERTKSVLEKIKVQPIDYNLKDTIRFYKKSFDFYVEKENLEKVWTKKIRYQILDDIAESSEDPDAAQTSFKLLESASKEMILTNEICRINTLLETKNTQEEKLYNFFCIYFDPHTAYFSNDSKSSFVASLSKERLSLGMSVNLNEKNEIIIEEIDPKGPAFKTGKIKKGDQIISISNQKETLHVSCSSLESISTMILSESNKNITLTLKRNSGKNFEVYIEKQVMKNEENSVFSFLIGKENKIGYIKIPSFYADLDGNSRKGCADDVAREVLKLERDHIKGLVIDLIDNGGGSMEEAIKLAGMFVDYGPISIVVDNKLNQSIINDPYKGVIYKGPIVILVNSNTASASEFFSSILQDYNRALLLGSGTLGKATMQTIVSLDENKNTDFLKITINKFYRVTGKSHQKNGVSPDVILPEFYQDIFQKESNFSTAIPNDSLPQPLKYRPYVKRGIIDKVAHNSSVRLADNYYFNNIKKINQKIDEMVNTPKAEIPMTLDAVFEQKKIRNSLWKEINTLNEENNPLDIYNSTVNQFLLGTYPSEKVMNEYQINSLKTNPYLNEAVNIINEFNGFK